jgi:hypothetical protein
VNIEPMFGSRRRLEELERFVRADVSLVSEVANALSELRGVSGVSVPVDELPIVVGTGTLHADAVAGMPARVRSSRVDRRVADLLTTPQPGTDYAGLVGPGTLAMFHAGYAALLLDRPAPLTRSVRLLEPAAVHPQWDPRDTRTVTSWLVDGQVMPANMIHAVNLIDDPRRSGPVGESPLRRCAGALELYGWAYRYLIDYFAGGGNPGSILKSSHNVTSTRATEIVDEWIAARRERRPAVMDPQLTFEVPASNGELGAVIQVLDLGAAEVARLLNIPGSLVNAPNAGGYSLDYRNVGEEFKRWLALSLRPTWMARWESTWRTLTGLSDVYLDPVPMLEAYGATDETTPAAGDELERPALRTVRTA